VPSRWRFARLSSGEWLLVFSQNSVRCVLVAVAGAEHLGEHDDHNQADEHEYGVHDEQACGRILVLLVHNLCSVLHLLRGIGCALGVLDISEVGRVDEEGVSHVCQGDTITVAKDLTENSKADEGMQVSPLVGTRLGDHEV